MELGGVQSHLSVRYITPKNQRGNELVTYWKYFVLDFASLIHKTQSLDPNTVLKEGCNV